MRLWVCISEIVYASGTGSVYNELKIMEAWMFQYIGKAIWKCLQNIAKSML